MGYMSRWDGFGGEDAAPFLFFFFFSFPLFSNCYCSCRFTDVCGEERESDADADAYEETGRNEIS